MSATNALLKVWEDHETIIIPNTNYTLSGFSIAAFRTSFYIKELDILFDAGLSFVHGLDHIFITHCHTDHTANLPFLVYNHKPNKKIQIYIPKASAEKTNKYIESCYILGWNINKQNDDDKVNDSYDIIGVEPNILELNIGKKRFNIEIIECYHSVPCVGYGLIEKRNKLKKEYLNLSGKELMEIKKKGIEINYEVSYPIFCFLGDTSKEILNNSSLKNYKNIMIECTFLFDTELEQADKTLHMHWKYLGPFIESNKEINFILYHFSQRYKRKEIKDFFDNQSLPNVIPWISN